MRAVALRHLALVATAFALGFGAPALAAFLPNSAESTPTCCGVGGSSGGGSGGGGPVLDLDCDLTAETTQTIDTDGVFSMCGLASGWLKTNSAHDASPLVVTHGVGLVVTPDGTTDFNGATMNAPRVEVNLAALLPGYTLDMPLRLTVTEAGNTAAADYDFSHVGFTNPTTVTYYDTGRGHSSSLNRIAILNVSGSRASIITTIGGFGRNVDLLSLPGGIASGLANYYSGLPDAGPAAMQLDLVLSPAGGMTTSPALGWVSASQVYAYMSASRAGSGTALAVTYSHIRIEHWL